MDIRDIAILDVHPSQFYLSEKKWQDIQKWFDPRDLSGFAPVPVKLLNGRVIFTDGHTRAYAAYQAGLQKIPMVWDEDDLDWEAYQMDVDACERRGIRTIADLAGRMLPHDQYVSKWNKWCDGLQDALDMQRTQK